MNFFPVEPNFNMYDNNVSNFVFNNELMNRLNEVENRMKKLEQRIIRLENEKNSNNYNEPDNGFYMI